MTIKDLKLMNEAERILWFASAKSSDLTLVLKNYGIKGLSKLKKVEKLDFIKIKTFCSAVKRMKRSQTKRKYLQNT